MSRMGIMCAHQIHFSLTPIVFSLSIQVQRAWKNTSLLLMLGTADLYTLWKLESHNTLTFARVARERSEFVILSPFRAKVLRVHHK